ncbi:MAG: DUF4214 domain-containing protein [Pseudomonadota bacterium]
MRDTLALEATGTAAARPDGDASFDAAITPFEELPYTSWIVEEQPAPTEEAYSEVTVEVHLPAFDPADVPFEELPLTSWMAAEPAEGAASNRIDTDGWVHLPAFDPFVDELFKVVFGRLSDDGGRDFWSAKTFGGTSLEDVADIFLDSFEFTDRWGENLSDEAFVEHTYLRALGRDADEAGKEFWVDRLADDDFGRGDLAAAFARFTHEIGEDDMTF